MTTWLKQAGYQPIGLADSQHALAFIRQVQPQLVILDLLMPTFDGLDLLHQLRTDPTTHHLPILVCSVTGTTDVVAFGANDYLTKPIHSETLLTLVRRWAPSPATVLVVDDDPDARQVVC